MDGGSLSGVRIADFSRVLAGPYATMMLADLGADVIKIERPDGGDETRAWAPPADAAGTSTYYLGVNRNKRSVTLDLGTEAARRDARRVIAGCDVLIENFRPGLMDSWQLGYDDLAADHPGLVYCSLTGFGTRGGAALPGYDLLVQAVGGLMSYTGHPGGEPTKVGVAMVDVITGLHAALGILAALRHRDATGQGQRVEVNLLSSLLSASVNQASGYVAAGAVPARLGNAHPSIAPYEVFAAKEGDLALAVGNDRQFARLVGVLGMPELAGDARFAHNRDRVRHVTELRALIARALGRRSAQDWAHDLLAAGVPAGQVNDMAGAFAYAQGLGLKPVVEVERAGHDGAGRDGVVDGAQPPARQVASPLTLSATPVSYRLPPPDLGEHTAAVLDRSPTAEEAHR